MARTSTRDRAEDEVKSNNQSNGPVSSRRGGQKVVSDRRARAKAKRGEAFTKVEATAAPAADNSGARRNAGTVAPTRNIFQRIPIVRPIYNYLDASVEELKKVTWPTREETIRLTRMVIILTTIASIVLGTIDLFYGWWFRQALDDRTLFIGLGVVVSILGALFTYYVFVRQDQYTSY